MFAPWKKSCDQPRQHIKKQRHYIANKIPSGQAMVFPLFMYECKRWTIKKSEYWRIDAFEVLVLEKTLEIPLDCKEIQLVLPKGNQSWIFVRTETEAETPILSSPYAENWFNWKDPDAGKDWRLEDKGTTEDEMVGWHQWLYGQMFD